jgi:hypothetical protein
MKWGGGKFEIGSAGARRTNLELRALTFWMDLSKPFERIVTAR